MEIILKPIGVIHTPLHTKGETPIQSSRSDIAGTVEVDAQFIEGLEGVEEFSHLYLLYQFHQADPSPDLVVHPFLDDQPHGVFATRFPARPNPLGISVVRVTGREGNLIHFQGADMWDGTVLLDIKPYIPDFDIQSVSKIGWYANRAHL